MKQYVIIGNGIAAAGCIEGIRSADPDGAITVVSAEEHPVYCRPLISYYLEGKTDLERMRYRDADFYDKNGCTVLYGRTAVGLDAKAKTVRLDDGTALPYDALCVAAGSSPFVPPFEGLETVENRFTFITIEDALALEQAVHSDSRVLIVGAGLIGLKCAEGLHARLPSPSAIWPGACCPAFWTTNALHGCRSIWRSTESASCSATAPSDLTEIKRI